MYKCTKGKIIMAESKFKYNDIDRAIVDALRGTDGLTLAEICEKTGLDIKAIQVVHAMNGKLVESIGEREIERPATKTAQVYNFVTFEHSQVAKKDGTLPEYSEGQEAILNAASSLGSFTMAQLSEKLGCPVYAGTLTTLVNRGNLSKGDKIEIEYMKPSKVKVFGYVAEVPEC